MIYTHSGSPKSYNITFDDGLDGTQNITHSYVYTHPFGELPVFKRLGYTLSGFFSEPEGGEKITAESKAPHSDTILLRALGSQFI